MDEILTARAKDNRPSVLPRAYSTLTRKNTDVTEGHTEVAIESARREMVQDVLRSHIQEVLAGLNEKPEKATQKTPGSNVSLGTDPKKQRQFEEIDAAAPELKQEKLMEIYFRVVRRKVIEESQESADRREMVGFGGLKKRQQTNFSTRTAETMDDDDEPVALFMLGEEHVSHEDIWCTLVFRMICWLMLHDFHKKDVQVSTKSELLGSRLPVYIS
ncbi:modin [Colletotrichum higginsianum]|nr:modin [Colletotrichum higginsianum]